MKQNEKKFLETSEAMEPSRSASSVTGLNIFFISRSGAWLNLLVLLPLSDLLYKPQMMTMTVHKLVEWELAGETDVARENLTQFHSVNHKSHMSCTLSESRPPQREGCAMVGPSGLNRFNDGRNNNNNNNNNNNVMLSNVHLRTRVFLYTMSKDVASVWESYGLYTVTLFLKQLLGAYHYCSCLVDTMYHSILETNPFVRTVWSSNKIKPFGTFSAGVNSEEPRRFEDDGPLNGLFCKTFGGTNCYSQG
jgi:hypothetical protein